MPDNIFLTLQSISGDVVLSQGGYGFQEVIDDFENANYINVVTYNIKPFEDSELLSLIKKIPYSVPVNIILNIPKKSYGSSDASNQVYWYLKTLERQKFNDLNVYFNFSNHAKLIMTNNKAYIGSQNFSDASSDKVELGIVVKDANDVAKINKKIFETIRTNSIRYATSDYVIKMEEIQGIMAGVLENLRYNIFTIAGDPPYTPEKEVFNINNAHFPKEEWSKFKDLDESLFDIIDKISKEYEEIFDSKKASPLKGELQSHLKSFISQVDAFAEYLDLWESRVFGHFYEMDDGDMDSTMNNVLGNLEEEKTEKFEHLNGEELLDVFDQIEPIVESILDLVEEIKYEMLKRTVHENQKLIEE